MHQFRTPSPAALASFSLASPPPGFIADPYPWYAALRRQHPVQPIAPGQWLLTRYDDVAAVYRAPQARSDKRREFGPKFGVGTPLFEHHTSSLVFNDAPLHSRVRRLLLGALNQRAIMRMAASVSALVERLSEPELLHNCVFLLNAGHETTTNLIGNGVHALLSQRQAWDRLVAEPALITTAVEALLRFESAPKAAALRRPPPRGEEKHLGRPGVCFSRARCS